MIYLIYGYNHGYNGSDSLHFHAACVNESTVEFWCEENNKRLVKEKDCKTGSNCVFFEKVELFNKLRPNFKTHDTTTNFKPLLLTDIMPFGKLKGRLIKEAIQWGANNAYFYYLFEKGVKFEEAVVKKLYKPSPKIFNHGGGYASCNELEVDAYEGCCPNM